mmetsp:Transcript_86452/g.217983  ORF Transcript_86452/g.217983 Transcript_86452/m.217983 type:complete len:264 (+) Transcript_86452:150-941(+)
MRSHQAPKKRDAESRTADSGADSHCHSRRNCRDPAHRLLAQAPASAVQCCCVRAHGRQRPHAKRHQVAQPGEPCWQGERGEAQQQCVRVHPREHSCAEGLPREAAATPCVGLHAIILNATALLPLPSLLEAQHANQYEHNPDCAGRKAFCRPAVVRAEGSHEATAASDEKPQTQEHLTKHMSRTPEDAGAKGAARPALDLQREGRQSRQVVGARQGVQTARGGTRCSGRQRGRRSTQQCRCTAGQHVKPLRDQPQQHSCHCHA